MKLENKHSNSNKLKISNSVCYKRTLATTLYSVFTKFSNFLYISPHDNFSITVFAVLGGQGLGTTRDEDKHC